MIIFYGWRTIILLDEPVADVKCTNCEVEETIALVVVQKYFYIFWVPFFPFEKMSKMYCTNCGMDKSLKDVSLNLIEDCERITKKARTPWYTYIGTALILMLFISIATNTSPEPEKKPIAEWIKAPHSKDVIEFKTETGNYSLMEVYDVVDDTVILFLHSMEHTLPSGLDELKVMKSGWKKDSLYAIHKQVLVDMFENHEILGIDRTFH